MREIKTKIIQVRYVTQEKSRTIIVKNLILHFFIKSQKTSLAFDNFCADNRN